MFRDHYLRQPVRKKVILFLACLTFIFALAMPDRHEMLSQYWKMQTSQTYLLRDFFETAGPSATFFNTATHWLLAYFLMSRNEKSNISGLQMAAIGFYIGHSFFGSTLLSAFPILIGVVLYAHWSRQSYKIFTTVSLFAIATSPIVTFIGLSISPAPVGLILAVLFGLVLGFIAPPLAEQFLKFHRGLTLYNYGFTTGIIAMFFAVLFPYFGKEVVPEIYISNQQNLYSILYFASIWLVFAGSVLLHWREAWGNYSKLLESTGRVPDDFVSKYGIYTSLLNICLNSSVYCLLLLFLQAPFNGPTLGGLCAILGFSAFGKHPRNSLPVSVGVILAVLLLGASLTDVRFQLALLLGTALAPISGYYGMGYGVLAGFLHYNLTTVTFDMHQGMTLYNNGFTTGFVAAFVAPLIDTIQENNHFWIKKIKIGIKSYDSRKK